MTTTRNKLVRACKEGNLESIMRYVDLVNPIEYQTDVATFDLRAVRLLMRLSREHFNWANILVDSVALDREDVTDFLLENTSIFTDFQINSLLLACRESKRHEITAILMKDPRIK
jgi:hypothetical protein